MTVTSTDVARRAGVSRATVSYVLNNTPGQTIPDHTRAQVRRAADELGYRPHHLARSLRRGRSDAVLCPLPGLGLPPPLARLVEACAIAIEDVGLFLIPDFRHHDDAGQQMTAWERPAPSAVIDILLPTDDPVLPLLRRSGIPVLTATGGRRPGWESGGDEFAHAERVSQLRYLLESGHRTIVSVVPRELRIDPRVERRLLSGLRRFVRDHGGELTIERVDFTGSGFGAAISRWLESGLPDAIAAHNDDYAIAVISALRARGLAVPDHIAVMGIDDSPLGAAFCPTITTIRPEFEAFAADIARALVSVLDGSTEAPIVGTPTHVLIRRESA